MGKGIFKDNGVHMEAHEFDTVKLLLHKDHDIELIPTSQIKGMRTPDILMDGILWEIKSPTGNGKNTIKHTIQNASHQSVNIIVDLRRIKMKQEQAITELIEHFNLSKRLKRMLIIKKDKEILDLIK